MKALIVLWILCSSQAGYWSGVGWNWSLLHVCHKLAAGSFVLPAAHGVPSASSASSHESCQGLMLSNSSYWSLLVSYKQAFGDSRKVKQLLTGSNLWWTRLRYGQQLAGVSGGRQAMFGQVYLLCRMEDKICGKIKEKKFLSRTSLLEEKLFQTLFILNVQDNKIC